MLKRVQGAVYFVDESGTEQATHEVVEEVSQNDDQMEVNYVNGLGYVPTMNSIRTSRTICICSLIKETMLIVPVTITTH